MRKSDFMVNLFGKLDMERERLNMPRRTPGRESKKGIAARIAEEMKDDLANAPLPAAPKAPKRKPGRQPKNDGVPKSQKPPKPRSRKRGDKEMQAGRGPRRGASGAAMAGDEQSGIFGHQFYGCSCSELS